jgi:nucleoside 2-deoxyribosyltransferase
MPRQCFVPMPFAPESDAIWNAVVRPAVVDVSDTCIRGDDIFMTGSFTDALYEQIRAADYLIADLTDRSPNVYYELGYAHAPGKPVILLTQDLADVAIDLWTQRIIAYTDTAAGVHA